MLKRFEPNYWLWITLGIVADVALWLLFRRRLQVDAGATLQSVLLLDTLAVVSWYAHLTRAIARSSTEQTAISHDQLEQSQRPCVVIEWQNVAAPPTQRVSGWTYAARNIGQGLALNVIHVEDLDSSKLNLLHVGALESGQAVELPSELVDQLRREKDNPIERKRHVLIAEPVGGERWIVSENLMERSGRLSHRVRTRTLAAEQLRQIHKDTAPEYIKRNWPAIQRELGDMLKEL